MPEVPTPVLPTSSLPEFDSPPLDEVAIGVQFMPLRNFSAAHLGMYWSRIRERYPSIEDNPPLFHRVENLDPKPTRVSSPQLIAEMTFPLRCWYISPDSTELLQVQNDQFFRNWRRVTGNEPYPRFPALLTRFLAEWNDFQSFVRSEQLGEVRIDQCELTYINHAAKGEGWERFSEIGNVLSSLGPPSESGLLSDPELVNWSSTYKLPDNLGRLRATMTPVFRGRDFKMVLSLNLTARGAPLNSSDDALIAWFDLAHTWVVTGFAELTTSAMHEIWKRRR